MRSWGSVAGIYGRNIKEWSGTDVNDVGEVICVRNPNCRLCLKN